MKRFVSCYFLLVISLLGYGQNDLDSAWIRDNYQKMERMIPMRDGVKLFTSIYVPRDVIEKHPVLITRTPYSCSPYGENNFRDFHNGYLRHYLRDGYIIVTQDVRGRFMSEGTFEDIRPFNPNKKSNNDIDEASDTYDTIDWLVKNLQNNNGNVGVFGISYPGFYSSMAALSGHPALKAVSPQAPVTEWFIGDDWHHNGALFLMDAFGFYTGFGMPRPSPVQKYNSGYIITDVDNYDFYLKTGAVKNFTALFGDSVKFWKDLMAHPNYDTFWKARNVRNFVSDIKPAVLTVGGLFDAEDCYGAWRFYEAVEKKNPSSHFNKIVMGPWSHGQWAGNSGGDVLGNIHFNKRTGDAYKNQVEKPFFDYFLRGKGSLDKLAEATIFFSGENKWRKLNAWPPAEKVNRALYLQPDFSLSWTQSKNPDSYSEYVSDPAKPVPYTEDVHMLRTTEYMTDDQRFASRRPDVLTFKTGILEKDLTLAGPVIADLVVSISSTDADFVVKIIDEFPGDFKYTVSPDKTSYPMGGYQMLVRGEIMRGRYRNSFENPAGFTPGKIEKVKYELPDIAHTFQKGHRLVIQIQSSWFPLADRNPQQFIDIYHCDDKDFKKATIKIHHNAKNSSSVMLPVLSE